MKEVELRALLKDMSLEEKIGQMVQLNIDTIKGGESQITGPTGIVDVTDTDRSLCGTILGTFGAEELIAFQKEYMEKQPHHIPMLFMMDVINGLQTIFPVPLAQGCSFDPEISRIGAEIAAKEAAAAGVHVTFAPMCDLVRDARWGRVMESPGEDPYLISLFTAAMTKGFQQGNAAKEGAVAACLKHFAGYGYPEGGREYDNVELSERTFLQDYLTGYTGAISENVKMAMTSFNSLNRVPSSANRWLMRDILRKKLGFDGVLISDYAAVEELIPHGIAADKKEAARLALEAGVDIDMMTDVYLHHLKELTQEDAGYLELIDEAVYRILRLKNELGLFENPFKDADVLREKEIILCQEHRDAARKALPETFVLLKNEERILPLSKEKEEKLLFTGPYTDCHNLHGSWSFPRDPSVCITIRDAVTEALHGFEGKADFTKGSPFFAGGERLNFKPSDPMSANERKALLLETVEKAKAADKVVVCVGEHFRQTGEAQSRTELDLPKSQMELLRAVSAVNPNVITVVFTGRPLVMQEIEKLSKAVLYVWMPGTEGAHAISDVLFGDREPGGRLAMSFPCRVGQEPLYYNRFMSGRPRNAGDLTGYGTGYTDLDYQAYHPFGFGMSYTEFSYSPVTIEAQESENKNGLPLLRKGKTIKAKAVIKNIGSCRGSETVQFYIRDLAGSVVRPIRELKGFKKIVLDAGEEMEVSFEISEEMLKFYRIDMSFDSEPGAFEAFIGKDSSSENKAVFVLTDR